MPLPILQPHADPTAGDLLRFFARAQLHWARHLAEEATLDLGTAFANAELPRVFNANRVMDAALPAGVALEGALAEVDAYFAAAKSRCRVWEMNPAAPVEQTKPITDHLLAAGYRREYFDVMYLKSFPTEPLREVGHLKIIPARASFRHARALAEESARAWNAPTLADAKMLHLDDPHTDALLAIRDGVAAGMTAVLSVGEIGAIQELFVSASFRRQGIGRTLMSRALEICARSLFKHVLLAVAPDNLPAIALYHRCGFQKVGETVSYHAPAPENPS